MPGTQSFGAGRDNSPADGREELLFSGSGGPMWVAGQSCLVGADKLLAHQPHVTSGVFSSVRGMTQHEAKASLLHFHGGGLHGAAWGCGVKGRAASRVSNGPSFVRYLEK